MSNENFEFFNAIFRHAPSTSLVRWGPTQPALFLPLSDLFTDDLVWTEGNTYFGPAVRGSEDPSKLGVLGASVAWLDYDAEEGNNSISLLPPSIMVASGGLGKFHYYWLLSRFIDADYLETVNKAIAQHHNDKGGTWDCTRLLRVPGSPNLKYKPPRLAEIKTLIPQRVYDPEELEKLQAFDPDVLSIPDGRSRSERDFRLARLLASWGLSDDSISLSLLTYSSKSREAASTYIPRTIEKARQSLIVLRTSVQAKSERAAKRAGVTPAAKDRVVANFWAIPVASLENSNGHDEGMMLEVGWGDASTRRLRATQNDFESRRSINAWLNRNGLQTRMWLGSDKDAADFWVACVDSVPETVMLLVPQAGRHVYSGVTMFIYGRENALCYPACNTVPVLWSSAVAEQRELSLSSESLSPDALERLIDATLRMNVPHVILPTLGWTLATAIKPVIEQAFTRFPILLLFGQRGSGKTSLLRDGVLPLVGGITPIGSDVTRFALLSAFSSYNAVPVWLGEFRASLPNSEELQTYLRMAYDGAREERGRSDQRINVYELTAPVVVDGETLFPDSAVRERTLPVRLLQTDILNTDHTKAMRELRELRGVQEAFAREYLEWTLRVEVSDAITWLAQGEKFFAADIPQSRLVGAASVALVGMRLLQEFAKEKGVLLPLSDEALRVAILKTMDNVYVHGLGVRTPVENMLEILAHAYRSGQQWATQACDYREGVLWFNVTTCHHWIRRFWHGLPDRDMLMPQIEERVGVYIEKPVNRSGGIYFGLNVAKAQELGLDVPTPISLMMKEKGGQKTL